MKPHEKERVMHLLFTYATHNDIPQFEDMYYAAMMDVEESAALASPKARLRFIEQTFSTKK